MPMDRETGELIGRVHGLFKARGLTLAVAESCTGGLVCHYLTSLPGASLIFAGGLIVYSGDMKKRLLGVPAETIDLFGVVSQRTACEMAEKARTLCRTDWGLATTGNLGPDVLEGKEMGLVYVAVKSAAGAVSRELHLTGTREENKAAAALSVLELLAEAAEAAT